MADDPYHFYARRIDNARNMARYYMLSIQPTLFGEIVLMRCWGRIGKRGGEKSEVFASEQEAAAHFLKLARRKHQKGYKPVGNCGKAGKQALSDS
ncbi:WGR domain-containing protein [Rhizobium terrae]|uniref:WGR domain-containing protein n=1 Tax=Rhizobium terrae TaxID=2171756 RepID=UPI000E3CE0BD|nr:WGR domain-containing protein [Rhizobium terrae]